MLTGIFQFDKKTILSNNVDVYFNFDFILLTNITINVKSRLAKIIIRKTPIQLVKNIPYKKDINLS